jgi:hypothetical protein
MLIRTVYAVANTTPAGLHTFRSDEAKAEITLRAGARAARNRPQCATVMTVEGVE